MKTATIALFLTLAFTIFAHADVDFDYTWKSPEAEPVSFAGKKVAVILISTNRAPRVAAEEALAKEITKRGAEGVPANAIVTESEIKDPETAKVRFREQGVAGVVVIRGTPKGGEPVDSDFWKDPIYKDVWGFTSSSWKQAEGSEKKKDVKFRVEVHVYAIEQDRMIWMGTMDMKSSELPEFVSTIVDEIAEEMRKVNLLQPQ